MSKFIPIPYTDTDTGYLVPVSALYRYYTDTKQITFQTVTDTDISFILYTEPIPILSQLTDTDTGINITDVNW